MRIRVSGLIIGCMLSIVCASQSVVWSYQTQDSKEVSPSDFWIDNNGNGFFNINILTDYGSYKRADKSYLLRLNSSGNFLSSTSVNEKTFTGRLMPYQDSLFMSLANKSKVYDVRGNYIKEGVDIKGHSKTVLYTEQGYSIFSRERTGVFGFTSLNQIHTDWDGKEKKTRISTLPLQRRFGHPEIDFFSEKTELGLISAARYPLKLSKGEIILTMHYDTVVYKNNIPHGGEYHGALVCVVKDRLKWEYPKNPNGWQIISATKNENDEIGILSQGYDELGMGRKFTRVDNKGNEMSSAELDLPEGLVKIALFEDAFIAVNDSVLYKYDFSGEQIYTFPLKEIDNIKDVKRVSDSAVILVGRKAGNAIIQKINIDTIEEQMREEQIEEPVSENAVSFASIENVESFTLSASAYPNPASLYINFKLTEGYLNAQTYVIEVVDMQGRIVHTNEFSQNIYKLDLDNFKAGSYAYRILLEKEGNVEMVTGQFIKI